MRHTLENLVVGVVSIPVVVIGLAIYAVFILGWLIYESFREGLYWDQDNNDYEREN